MFIKKIFIIVPFLFFLVLSTHASNLIFGAKSSTIQIDSGASFIIESEISNVDGTISKDEDATLDGAEITFDNGSYVDGNTKVKVSGSLDTSQSNKITLDGNKIFTGKSGSLNKKFEVSGKNNKIEGNTTIADNITLQDSNTTLSIDLISNLKGDIYLNGGILYTFENNLKFDDHKKIVGPGTICINGNKLIFGSKSLNFSEPLRFIDAADVQLNDNVYLSNIWTFSGSSILEGNINIMDLSNNGQIIVENNSSILIKNMIIHGMHEGSICCMDNNSTITFQNVYIYLDSDYTFSTGRFEILNCVKVLGYSKFIYNSNKQSLIKSKSTLSLDNGLTFSYDPGSMRKDLIAFEDNLSTLKLNGATLYTTATGIQLTKGTLIINHNSYLASEKTETVDEGIIFGNSTAEDDLVCCILGNSRIELLMGSLKYKNTNPSSFCMGNYMSDLTINSGCSLYLYENLFLGDGTLNYSGRGKLYYVQGKNLSGTVNVSGLLDSLIINN